MEQDLCNIGIIGAGPAGCCCAYFLNDKKSKVTLIDYNEPLRTILPTGGGRCNLAHAEFDFKELAKNYPRGEKFLYSVFSKFSTADTLELFNELGVETYTQEDNRIFPISDSSKEVRDKLLSKLTGCKFIKEKALRIEKLASGFKVVTDMNSYHFDKVVFSVGGHSGYDMIKRLGVTIVEPKPSLVGLVSEKKFSTLMGIVLKDCYNKETGLSDNLMFTHFGISGPLVYKISSIKSRDSLPYVLYFDLAPQLNELQSVLNSNPHKFIKNVLSEYMPLNFAEFLLKSLGVDINLPSHKINGNTRDKITDAVHNFKIKIVSTKKDGETVTSGGVDLNEINPKTMECKKIKGLYLCGEVIDVDGFCGGFNLQNCWSTAFVAAQGISD